MDNNNTLPQPKISLFVQGVGFIFFSILFYISWKFYLERMLFLDNAFYFFQLMESGGVVTALHRNADYIPQLLPLFMYKMGYPLHTILASYSVSFIILHYFIFLFVTIILKNNGAGIAVMLISCLFYYRAFYFPLAHLNDSIIVAVLLWAFIHPEVSYSSVRQKTLHTIGALITVVYLSFLHPLGIVAILFMIGVEMLGTKRFKDPHLWIILIIGAGWFLLKSCVIFRNGYDSSHILPVSEIIQQIPNFGHWPSTQYIENLTWLHFKIMKWLLIFLILLSLRKGVLFFTFVTGSILVFTLMFLGSLYKGSVSTYYESNYCMYGVFTGILYVFFFSNSQRKNIALLLSLPLLCLGITRIYQAHDMPTYRVEYLSRLIKNEQSNGVKKGIVVDKCYPEQYASSAWAVTFETLIYSSLAGPDSSTTVFIKTDEFNKLCDTAKDRYNILFGPHFAPLWYASNNMPEKYFRLPPTGYTYLTHSQNDTSFRENDFFNGNIKIKPLVLSKKVEGNNLFTVIPLQIANTSGKIIPSIPAEKNGVYLYYKLYNNKGKEVKNGKGALETDVNASSEEGLLVYYPREKGVYTLVVDLATDGKRNWNIPVQPITIIVD
jgi:hypothetical protein